MEEKVVEAEVVTPKKELTPMDKLGRDYVDGCTKLGELYYKGEMFKLEMCNIVEALKAINNKAAELKKVESEPSAG